MKKFVIGLLALSLVLGGVAPAIQAEEKIKTAFIPQLIGIPYFSAMEEGGNEAAERFGVEFTYTGPTQTSAPEQVKIMESLVQQDYDAVSVSVLDPESINPAIKEAREKGLAVLTSDSDSSSNSERQAFVAQARDKDLGYTLIDELAKSMDYSGKIGIVSGEATATNLNSWISYMEERVAQEYEDIEIVDIRYTTGGSSEEAYRQSQQLMTAHPDLKGLVAVASTTVPGVARAVRTMNKQNQVSVTGYGSPNTVRSFIKSGVMDTSILWNPRDLGYLTVWAMKELAQGNEFERENNVPGLDDPVKWYPEEGILLLGPPLVITEDNVDDFNF
jgi:rhamnose transport system substrate-binding protein